MGGSRMGEARAFDARVSYTRADGSTSSTSIRPNQPLDVEGTKLFLSGHGYAPRVTVRDGDGEVAFSGSVIFLPMDGNFTSDGVIKAPNRSEEHTSELQSLMRTSYAVFCLKKKNTQTDTT